MLTRNQIRHIQSLRHAKSRSEHGQFVAEGVKLAAELLDSPLRVLEVFALKDWLTHHEEQLSAKGIPFQEIHEGELGKISHLVTPNEVVLLVKLPDSPADDLLSTDIILFLDRIQDPGNMGTILRTADWFGIRDIVCSPGCADVFSPKVVQASMGSITRVRVLEKEPEGFLATAGNGAVIYGAMADGESIYEMALETPAIIVIGNESQGISEAMKPFIHCRVGIPRYGDQAESLNAAVATGIVLAEFRRRPG